MKKALLIILLFSKLCFAQLCVAQEFFFNFTGKDTLIELTQNIKLIAFIENNFLQFANSIDGQEVVFIPTHIKIKRDGDYYFHRNHLVGYEYDPKKDEITLIEEANSVTGKEVDFKKKTIKDKKAKNNEDDYYKNKNKDRDKKIKDKEKKKLKIKPSANSKKKK